MDESPGFKSAAITISTVCALLNTPLLLSLISFEANCHNRTLLNRYGSTYSNFLKQLKFMLLVKHINLKLALYVKKKKKIVLNPF
jgi:hypothetical protein